MLNQSVWKNYKYRVLLEVTGTWTTLNGAGQLWTWPWVYQMRTSTNIGTLPRRTCWSGWCGAVKIDVGEPPLTSVSDVAGSVVRCFHYFWSHRAVTLGISYKHSHSEIKINSVLTFKFGLILFNLSTYFSFSQKEFGELTACIEAKKRQTFNTDIQCSLKEEV
jgi:hypothetical protein